MRLQSNRMDTDTRSPWDAVKIGFARKAARYVLRRWPQQSSDAAQELAAAILVEVSELSARGIHPSQRVYRLAAYRMVRVLWTHRGASVLSCATSEQDEAAPDGPCDREEMRVLSVLVAESFASHLDQRARDVMFAYLGGATVTEIAVERGETFVAVDSLLTRLMAHLRDGTVPTYRGQREVGTGACLGCGVALVAPVGRGGTPTRCKACAAARRKVKDKERHGRMTPSRVAAE